jgi:transcriptional regulator GlxA family with amidase domain
VADIASAHRLEHQVDDVARGDGSRRFGGAAPEATDWARIRQARAILTHSEKTVSSVARLLGLSRPTMYRYRSWPKTQPAIEPAKERRAIESG